MPTEVYPANWPSLLGLQHVHLLACERVKQAVERVAKGLALIIEAHIAALSRACEGSDIDN